MTNIPVAGPWITDKEVRLVTEAAAHAWYSRAGEYTRKFEEAFARYIGARHAVSLPSCTSAIHLSLLALGIGAGDEVAVPELTWIATAAPISYVRATPVFVDVDPKTWCMSAESLAASITPKTRAVIPVDLYGGMPDWDEILDVTERHGIPVVEDAAEALGSLYRGRKAGSFGVSGVFSFHGSKTLTTGEGGMLVTDDDAFHERVLFLRDHGRPPGDRMFTNREVAYKYKMSDLQAALGLAQLERIDELVKRKREVFSWYASELGEADGLTLNSEPEGTLNSYWMTTLLWDPALGMEKGIFMDAMTERGIDTRPFFHPLSSLPAYHDHPESKRARTRNLSAYALSPFGVNLPSALRLTPDDTRFVCQSIKDILLSS